MTNAVVRGGGLSMLAPLIGAGLWVVAVPGAAAGFGEPALVGAMLLLGALVIVPAAIPLHPAGGSRAATVAQCLASRWRRPY